MPDFVYKEALLSEFSSIDTNMQEHIFSVSCFEPSHWEASPSWDLSRGDLDQYIEEVLDTLLSDSQRRAIERNEQIEKVHHSFYHGDMINQLFCQYLSSELSLHCSPESTTGTEDFDITVHRDEMPLCNIGVKRMATSSNILDNLYEHRDNVQTYGDGDYSLLAMYFPLTDSSNSNRARDLISQYEYLSPELDSFYSQNNRYVATIPAPINSGDNDIKPLEETKDILTQEFGIGR